MIKSFADKETELVYKQKFSKRLPNTIQKVALRKMRIFLGNICNKAVYAAFGRIWTIIMG